jgi:hypothetical protein
VNVHVFAHAFAVSSLWLSPHWAGWETLYDKWAGALSTRNGRPHPLPLPLSLPPGVDQHPTKWSFAKGSGVGWHKLCTILSRFLLLSVVAFFLPMRNAVACFFIPEEGCFTLERVFTLEDFFTLPPCISIFIVLMLTIAMAAVVWGIKGIFFRRANGFTMLALVSMMFGIVLGAIAAFAIPRVEAVYQSFGAELPMLTEFVLRFRFLLWLPLLLTAISFRRLRLQVARLRRCLLLATMGETMLLFLVLAALSTPIFKLGCVV